MNHDSINRTVDPTRGLNVKCGLWTDLGGGERWHDLARTPNCVCHGRWPLWSERTKGNWEVQTEFGSIFGKRISTQFSEIAVCHSQM